MPNHVLQLDRLLRTALTAFVADATAEQWQPMCRLKQGLRLSKQLGTMAFS